LYSLNLELLSTFTSSNVAAKHLNYSDPTIMKYARSEARPVGPEYILSLKEKSVFEKTKELISKNMSEVSTSRSFTIYVYSLDNQLLNTFSSSNAAARYFQAGNGTIMKYA
jgi:hypothetical protein